MSPRFKPSGAQLGLAALSGCFLFLSFSLPRGIVLTPLAWFALVPLFIALKDTGPKKGFWLGFISGFIGCFGIYYWIPYCMIHFAGMSKPVAYLALFLLVLILACYVALFAALLSLFRQRPTIPRILIGPALWVALEYLRTYFPLGGFPWALLGASQYKFLPAIQVAELGGVYLVSWLVALVNFGIAALLEKLPPSRKAWQESGLALVCFFAALIFGQVRIGQVMHAFSEKPEIRVAIVQGNIDQSIKWSPQFFWTTLVRHIELSKELLQQPRDLLVWPEAAVTTFFNEAWESRDSVYRSLTYFDAYFLFGSIARQEENGSKKYFNSAFLLSPRGEKLLGRYDKMHLVPFGEYVPMQKLLFWVDAIAKGNTGNTHPGQKIELLDTGSYKIGCVICYELIFPNLVRKFVKAGAQVMSTLTNDAWFGPTSAPYQHHSNMVLRAVENRVYFIRAANTGISGICDPCGRIISQSPIYEISELEGIVRPGSMRTLYTRLGDWFALLCLGLTLAALAIMLITRPGAGAGGKKC